MPEGLTILKKDEDFRTFGEKVTFSPNNHYEARHRKSIPSEVKPFYLTAEESPKFFLFMSYKVRLLKKDIKNQFVLGEKTLYITQSKKEPKQVQCTVILPSKNVVTFKIMLDELLAFDKIERIEDIQAQINQLKQNKLDHLNPLRLKELELIEELAEYTRLINKPKEVLLETAFDIESNHIELEHLNTIHKEEKLDEDQSARLSTLLDEQRALKSYVLPPFGKNLKPFCLRIHENIPCATFTEERKEFLAKNDSKKIKHFNVPEDSIGLMTVNGEPWFAAPGNHATSDSEICFIRTESLRKKHIQHGKVHIVKVLSDELYFITSPLWKKEGEAFNFKLVDFKLLGPGIHVFELENAIILPVTDPNPFLVKVEYEGEERTLFVKVPQGEAGILQDEHRQLCILPPGSNYVNAYSIFYKLLSTETCIIEIPVNEVFTSDNVLVDAVVLVHYRIASPYYAIKNLGMNNDGEKEDEILFKPDNITKIIEETVLTAIKLQISSNIKMKVDNTPSLSYYDPSFNQSIKETINKNLNWGTMTGYIIVSRVLLSSITISDPAVALECQSQALDKVIKGSQARFEQLPPEVKEMQSLFQEQADLQANTERVHKELERVQAKTKELIEFNGDEVSLLEQIPGAKEIYELEKEYFKEVIGTMCTFFYNPQLANEGKKQASAVISHRP